MATIGTIGYVTIGNDWLLWQRFATLTIANRCHSSQEKYFFFIGLPANLLHSAWKEVHKKINSSFRGDKPKVNAILGGNQLGNVLDSEMKWLTPSFFAFSGRAREEMRKSRS